MGTLDRFTDKLEKELMTPSLPDECKLYFHYVEYYLEGFEFKNNVSHAAIATLKNEYNIYQNEKNTSDFKTAARKYDHYTFLKDFIKERKNYECAEALALLLMYDIMTHYRYTDYGNAVDVFKDYLIQKIKKLDRNKIPESFFCHYNADEIFEKEKDLTRKYLDLYDAYTKVCLKLSKYEDDEDY